MSTFAVEMEDGSKFEIEADTEPSEKEILDFISKQPKESPEPEPSPEPPTTTPEAPSPTSSNTFIRGTTALEQSQDVFMIPLFSVQRAQQREAAKFFETLDRGTRVLEERFGISRSGTFGQMARVARQAESDVPEVGNSNAIEMVNRGIGSVIGSVPGIASRFALAEKIPGLGGVKGIVKRELSNIGKFAVVEGVEGFRKEGLKGIVPAAIEGAEFAVTFPLALKAIQMTTMIGINSAAKMLEIITGKPDLVKRFMENPNKFNINPFNGKTKSLEDKVAENDVLKEKLRQTQKFEKDTLKEELIAKREKLNIKLSESQNKLSKVQTDATESIRQSTREKTLEGQSRIKQLQIEQSNALADYKNSANENLLRIYDSSLKRLDALVKQEGEQVGIAVGNVLNKDVAATARKTSIMNRIKNIAEEEGYVIKRVKVKAEKGKPKSSKLVVEPKFKSAEDKGVTKRINLVLDDLEQGFLDAGGNGIALGRLQAIKTGQQRISRGTSGQLATRADKVSGRISTAINPAKLDKREILAKNAEQEIKELGQVNAKFSTLKKQQAEAIKNYTTKDANGNHIPDIKKAVTAVRGGDPTTLRQMRKADAALPQEAKILPQVEEHVANLNKAQTQSLANVRLMKKQTNIELQKLHESQRLASNVANLSATRQRSQLARSQREFTIELRDRQRRELVNTLEDLNKTEQFLRDQIALRQFAGSGFSRTLQGVAAFGLLGAAGQARAGIPGVGVSVGLSIGSVLALSPNLQANILKTQLNIANKIRGLTKTLDLVIPEGKTEIAKKIIAQSRE